jgi:hypothetical protein
MQPVTSSEQSTAVKDSIVWGMQRQTLDYGGAVAKKYVLNFEDCSVMMEETVFDWGTVSTLSQVV